MGRGPERWQLYRLLGHEIVRAVRERTARLTARPEILTRARVTALVIAPHDLRTSDASLADDIYSGLFVFAGRSLIVSGRSPSTTIRPLRNGRTRSTASAGCAICAPLIRHSRAPMPAPSSRIS
ncbi:hypothetical protein GCM10025880_55960 [Methylorubrum aminovorans]|nr:hypothetical protein GCM10025880_55960 [Methylorubrum aminovorans]